MRRWMFLPRVQQTAQMSHVQFTEKLFDDTVLMRTSPTANSRDASDSVTNTPAVQLAAQRQMPTTKQIPKTVEILHVVQRQCPSFMRSRRSLSYRS